SAKSCVNAWPRPTRGSSSPVKRCTGGSRVGEPTTSCRRPSRTYSCRPGVHEYRLSRFHQIRSGLVSDLLQLDLPRRRRTSSRRLHEGNNHAHGSSPCRPDRGGWQHTKISYTTHAVLDFLPRDRTEHRGCPHMGSAR